jgi:alpha-maltose-1-phosphate synthase
MNRLRALLIAEAANPEWTSVPLVGYSHARALFELCDAHVVTQVRNREALVRSGLAEGRDFTALDSEPVASPLYKATEAIRRATGLGWTFDTAMQALPYYYFERLFWQRFGAEIASGKWDVVHRITPLSPTIASVIVPRCKAHGVPFVWGPINGGVPWPPGFAGVQRREGEWLHYVRNAYRFLPGYASTLEADCILAGSIATYEQLPDEARRRAIYLPENAIDEQRFATCKSGPVERPLRVAFVGRLVAYKGADMLIEAARPLLAAGKLQVDIIGDGPEREPLRALVAEHGLGQSVHLEGWVPHAELAPRLLQSDVFGFPSVREFGGGVVLEAMALGLVPVVVDYGGPSELVNDATGYRIPIGSRAEIVERLRAVLARLSDDPAPLRAMGERARARVLRHFTWREKAKQSVSVYRWVRGEGPRPDFGMPVSD